MDARIERLKKVGLQKVLSDGKLRQLFHQVALDYLGENCLNCDSKIKQNYQLLIHKTPNKMSSNYKLKDGILLSIVETNEDYTNSNLTDEKAEAILRKNLSYIRQFASAPNMKKLKEALINGATSLDQVDGLSKKGESKLSFRDKLIALNGVGPASADKIIQVYPTEDVLREALDNKIEMKFLGRSESKIIKVLNTL